MNVGDYVRTKYGVIAKITEIIEDLSIDCDKDVYYENGLKDNMPMMEIPYNLKNEYIVKSSPDVIDLIEFGDYVNGHKVLFAGAITWDNDGNVLEKRVHINQNGSDIWLMGKNIKSIVTKEMFEQMEYKVGGDK